MPRVRLLPIWNAPTTPLYFINDCLEGSDLFLELVCALPEISRKYFDSYPARVDLDPRLLPQGVNRRTTLCEFQLGQRDHDVAGRDGRVGQEAFVFEKGRLNAGYKRLKDF